MFYVQGLARLCIALEQTLNSQFKYWLSNRDIIVMHVGASWHKALSATQFLDEKNIKTLPWSRLIKKMAC